MVAILVEEKDLMIIPVAMVVEIVVMEAGVVAGNRMDVDHIENREKKTSISYETPADCDETH